MNCVLKKTTTLCLYLSAQNPPVRLNYTTSFYRSISILQVNCDTLCSSLWWVPCINIVAHLYRRVHRSCFSSRPSGWVPGRLMDGAHPLWPTEFYLRLTSRCCHRRFLTAPPSSISLLHSAHSVCFNSLCTPSPPFFLSPCPHMPPVANIFLCCCLIRASGHPSSLWHGRFPSSEWQTRWSTNTHTVHTHKATCLHSTANFNTFMDVACPLLVWGKNCVTICYPRYPHLLGPWKDQEGQEKT